MALTGEDAGKKCERLCRMIYDGNKSLEWAIQAMAGALLSDTDNGTAHAVHIRDAIMHHWDDTEIMEWFCSQ